MARGVGDPGRQRWQYWRYVALPVLWPSLLGTTLLLFANAFGAIATAYALTGSSLNIVTILLYAQIRGDVLHDQNLGYALALGMILITGALERRLHLAARPQRTVAAMKQSPARRLARHRPRRALFPRAADRHLRVLAAHAPRRLQLRRLSVVLRRSALPGDLRLFDGAGARDHRRRRAAGRADRLLDPAAPAAAAARSSSSSRCCRWSSRRSSSSSAISASTTAPRWLPLTGNERSTDLLLTFSYVTLALPYMYRAVDTGLARHRRAHPDRGGGEPGRQLADDPVHA